MHGLWIRNSSSFPEADLVTLFEGVGAITPHHDGWGDLLEVSVESHEISARRPGVFNQFAFHLLLDPDAYEGIWTGERERHVGPMPEAEANLSEVILSGLVFPVSCPSQDQDD